MMKIICRTAFSSLTIDNSSMLCIGNAGTELKLLLGGRKVIPRYEMQLCCSLCSRKSNFLDIYD